MSRHRSKRTPCEDTRVSGLVVQLLTTEWTKEARGGPGARTRNSTPPALVLPKVMTQPEDAPFRLHHVYFSEQRSFLPRQWTDVHRGKPFVEVEAFRVEHADDGVRVLLDHGKMGLPGSLEWSGGARGQRHEALFHLSPGEWGRGVYNERIQYWETGHWGYCKHVLNVGLLEAADLDVFLSTRPDHEAIREYLLRQGGPAAPGSRSARLHIVAS
ncbi:hypothetical protein JRI60_50740 [Archangium violaceum]|uniref:hypothetical protein n=1 Tax=Archangium violaceum TaxID=83451 RepID=UPI0019509337|nr:hypothetical protein [Archangium violaceum]QRN97141.1 hypothetical protein JRI60_50740 [Archangium violaceum]